MISKAVKALKLLLSPIEPPPENPRSTPVGFTVPVVAQIPDDSADSGAFDDAIVRTMQTSGGITAGSLELIGLDDIRHALGSAWASVSERVRDIAERELQRSLDAADIFRPYGETSYLIHFEQLDRAAAELKAQRAAFSIKAALIERVPEIAEAIAVKQFVVDLEPFSLPGDGRSLTDFLAERLLKISKETEALWQRDRKALITSFGLLFSPVWHSRKQVALFNRCVPNVTYTATLSPFHDYDPETLQSIHAEIDYLTLTKSLEAVHQLTQSGRGAVIMIPVNFSTLDDEETFGEYKRLLAAVPVAFKKYLIVEIYAGARPCSPAHLLECTEQLEKIVRYVAVELKLDDPRFEEVIAGRPWAVSVNMQGHEASILRGREQLRSFHANAKSSGVNTLAHGANSLALAQAASEAGFTYVDGPAVHLAMREPRPPFSLRPLQGIMRTRPLYVRPNVGTPDSR